MTFGELLKGVDVTSLSGDVGVEIKSISHDSRDVSPGVVFVALRGGHADGLVFASDALKRGASALVYGGPSDGAPVGGFSASAAVKDVRAALAAMSCNFYDNPSGRLVVVGVTGTNGKTTTTRIIKSALEAGGKKAGLIGTINYIVGGRTLPAPYTTPESVDFQRLLDEMSRAGCSHAVVEVSSHALSQRRVDGTRFGVAVFTNLTRDHLDFHGDMEGYFGAKKRLFEELLHGPAVINVDDPYGRRLAAALKGRALTYAIENEADLKAAESTNAAEGLALRVTHRGAENEMRCPLSGRTNAYNVLAAAGACLALGLPWDEIAAGVSGVGQVEGRFEKVEAGQEFLCVIDYAHTEDALRRLIETAREMTKGRVITVFGCGGDRDRGKRPAMGAVATELSDMVIITNDNPRGEDPLEIIRQVASGARRANYKVVPDRAEAINEAVLAARPLDTVLIAGKGHEDYQEALGVRRRFSDREAALRAIGARTGGAG